LVGAWDDWVVAVSVVLLVAVAAIVVGMIAVAVGRGGEMTEFSPDVRPLDTDIATAADVALLRPPLAVWGYDRRSTDEALNLVARTVTERDVEIEALRRQIADLQSARDASSATPVDLDALWRPRAFPAADAATGPDDAWEPGAAVPLSQPDPGSLASPLVRMEASPAPPPVETEPWLSWEPSAPAQRPDTDDPPNPGEPG
jgi:hypothetical protein